MQRGSSGAEFTFLADRVVKRGESDRVMLQGTWLQRHQTIGLPRVFQVYVRSYVMERLNIPPLWALDHYVVLDHMFGTLRADVWSQPAEIEHDINETEIKYAALCEKFQLHDVWSALDKLLNSIKWDELHRCLTHGDPTFDNVMFRDTGYGGDLVLVDPIPATPAVPDLQCVDIGKILQSALSWEEIRYGAQAFKFNITAPDVGREITDRNEWRAAAFWAAVHILRTFPYVPESVHLKLKERIYAAIRLGV